MKNNRRNFIYLNELEEESIYIIREVIAEFSNPVMMYSVGKDSSVMLHLARKAFYPGRIPFPLLHIDTGWKFNESYKFRDYIASSYDCKLLVFKNMEGVSMGINPFVHGSEKYTDVMKTEGLKKALNKYNFDAAFGGARRDEELSRAKERIFSFRNIHHQWDPKNQRPELWKNYNCQINKGESMRIFPLSNWTELDIWLYIYLENIEIVSLYFAKKRPVIKRNNVLIMINDNRINLQDNEVINEKIVRFRTLGCWPLTSPIESHAKNVPEIIKEMLENLTSSERKGRMIDFDQSSSMEIKKRQGYF